jgi:hypothetical protein
MNELSRQDQRMKVKVMVTSAELELDEYERKVRRGALASLDQKHKELERLAKLSEALGVVEDQVIEWVNKKGVNEQRGDVPYYEESRAITKTPEGTRLAQVRMIDKLSKIRQRIADTVHKNGEPNSMGKKGSLSQNNKQNNLYFQGGAAAPPDPEQDWKQHQAAKQA